MLRALVAGWFSFPDGHATAGDVLAARVASDWLHQAGLECDIAMAEPIGRGCDWRTVDPHRYSHAVFVCGPFQRGALETEFLLRFASCKLVGLDLSMLLPLETWNPFDYLLERNSNRATRPDIVFASQQAHVPILGVCRVEPYDVAPVDRADAAIDRLLQASEAAIVNIDTRLDENSTGMRNAGQIESLVARMDAVVTTRLHGMVLALKNAVPVVAIDPEPGGAKVLLQAQHLRWPAVFTLESATESALQAALEFCLTQAGRAQARASRALAAETLARMRCEFIASLGDRPPLEGVRRDRAEPLVSVIIPCYDQAHYLGEAIESALAQTYTRREIIVVDDGSRDAAAAEVAARYPGVICLRQANGGLSAARNAGIRESRGEYLVFLDADDRLLAHALRTGIDCFRIRPECAYVSGHYRLMRSDGKLLPEFAQEPPGPDVYRTLLQRNYIGMHATVMYRRAALESAGGFDTSLRACEDYDMYLRIARCHPVLTHHHVVAEYRRHEGAMSMDPARLLTGALAAFARQWRHVRGSPHYLKAQRAGIRCMRRYACRPLLRFAYVSALERRPRPLLRLPAALLRYLPSWFRALWFDFRLSVRMATSRSQ